MNLRSNITCYPYESRAVLSVHIIAFSCAHQERATPTAMPAKWNACLCVCVSMYWAGHLRSAAACYVFLAKKRSITQTQEFNLGCDWRLNQTWQDLHEAWQDSRPHAKHITTTDLVTLIEHHSTTTTHFTGDANSKSDASAADVFANSDKSISPCDICVTFVSKFCGVNVLGLWLMSWLLFSCCCPCYNARIYYVYATFTLFTPRRAFVLNRYRHLCRCLWFAAPAKMKT